MATRNFPFIDRILPIPGTRFEALSLFCSNRARGTLLKKHQPVRILDSIRQPPLFVARLLPRLVAPALEQVSRVPARARAAHFNL
jgi:hypothetical protein